MCRYCRNKKGARQSETLKVRVIRSSIDSYEDRVLAPLANDRGEFVQDRIACVRIVRRGLGSVRTSKGGGGP